MTFINQLLCDARNGERSGSRPTHLEVPENHVGPVAEHIRRHLWVHGELTKAECEVELRKGAVKLMGIPLRVVPKRTQADE